MVLKTGILHVMIYQVLILRYYIVYITKQIDAKNIVSKLGVSWKDTMLSIEKLYDAKLV